MSRARLGYIGIGNMGGAIASALAESHEVLVFDRSSAATARCAEKGCIPCTGAADLARRCDLVFLCLPSSDHVAEALADGSDFLSSAAAGTLVVDQSTSHPLRTVELSERLARRGLALVDAPVSGGPAGVANRTVLFTVGGSVEQYGRVRAVLGSITPHVLHTGPVGSAMTIKVANNYLAAVQAVASLQVVALAAKFGCDPALAADALLRGSGSNYYISRFLKSHVLAGRLDSGATIEVMQKDVALACELSERSAVPLVGETDLRAVIDRCVERYGRQAPYNAVALTIGTEAGIAFSRRDHTRDRA